MSKNKGKKGKKVKSKFPKSITVVRDWDGQFYSVKDAESAYNNTDARQVAVYELKGVKKIVVTVEDVK